MNLTALEAFSEFKSRLELTQSLQDVISTRHNAIREWIESCGSSIETKLIGSLQRKTRIQRRSDQETFDIDILVVLGDAHAWVYQGGVSPSGALDKVGNIVEGNETYERIGAEKDSPAIVLRYADNIKVELIPAYRDLIGNGPDGTATPPKGRGYWIPKNGYWVMADYDYDAEHISELNEENDDYLVPTIKMLKAAKRHRFADMTSYHLESLAAYIIPMAVQHFKQKNQPVTYPLLVWSFFVCAVDQILKVAHMIGSKSPAADACMSAARRQELSALFQQLANDCGKTFTLSDTDAGREWGKIFGPPFPSALSLSLLEALVWQQMQQKLS